jgi:hypothetical protein
VGLWAWGGERGEPQMEGMDADWGWLGDDGSVAVLGILMKRH